MRKVVFGFFAILLILAALLGITKAYLFSIGYIQPFATDSRGVSYTAKVEGKNFYVLDAQGQWKDTFLAGVDIGLGVPGAFPGEFAIGYDTYFDWLTQIGEMGSNVVRVYTPQAPAFYYALYEYNRVAASPLYLMQGVYMDEEDVAKYADVFNPQSTTIAEMRQDIVDCVNMLHGNAVIGAKAGKASGVYRYDVSKYVIGWILGIECEAYLVNGTNEAHPEIKEYQGKYVYTENASAFEVFIAQMNELVIAYETEHYDMQRPVAFSNWVTTDPLTHPNEPRAAEDSAVIDVEHIKGTELFNAGFFASYHVYPYYPDFLNFPSGDTSVDADSYYAYVLSLVDYHTMPVLISEFGLPTARGVTHINHLSGLNQGGNSETQQGEGLVHMLGDIHMAGCMGGIVFAWQDEWFKTSWNTMDFDDSSARPKWQNVESSEENFGLTAFTVFSGIEIDGDDSDWNGVRSLDGSEVKVDYNEAYLYLRLPVEDFEQQTYYVPIDTIAKEGNASYQGVSFAQYADFLLVLNGRENTCLLVDPYYNVNYKLYGKELFSQAELDVFAVLGNGAFIDVQQVICNKLLMPQTGQEVPVQLWDTGKMLYGNSNPRSEEYSSLADFCAGEGFVEIRIPWMLLNFADPSSGKILHSLHTESGFGFESISSIAIGLAKANETETVAMSAYTLPSWGAVSYQQRMKQSYYMLQKVFPQYATYPVNRDESYAKALRLQDTRLLYVRLDREMRNTELVIYLLIFSLLIAIYLFILLLVVNIHLNRVARRQERERVALLALLPLPENEIRKKLNLRFLCSARGAELLCRFLTEELPRNNCAALVNILCTDRFYRWMKRTIATRDLMLRILIVRLAGLLQNREFESSIIPLMKAHIGNLDLQYAGFLALSMMGNRDSLVLLCSDPSFTRLLSYRSLKEICNVYSGDKQFLYEKMIDSQDYYIRRIMIKSIGTEGFTTFAPRLLPMLDDTDANLLCDVVRALGQLRFAAAGPRIAAFVKSENWTLRNVMVKALAEIDAETYLPELTECLKDREWWVRYNSAKELCAHVPLNRLEEILLTLNDLYAQEILRFALQEANMMGKGAEQA
ncbi:MAG: HEAT repeat domain-containing protein [Eubacteriales bacterium]|nr:HEAT repeat domain-containing protein [Eubacteriales bacterium]